MATDKKSSTRIHTPEGVAAYVYLFTPRQRTNRKTGKPEGEPSYSMSLFFDSDTDIKAMKALAQRVGTEKFGPNFVKLVKSGKMNWPFQDCPLEDSDGNPAGPPFDQEGVTVKFKSTDKPGIVDENADPVLEKGEIYSGMKARVSARCFAYDNESRGVAFRLVNVQKTGDGERMSGDPSAEDDFGGKNTGKKRNSKQDDDVDDLL